MKRKLLFLLLTFSFITSYAQITFQKGYFIDNGDQKINCLIKNIGWNSNPTEFQYKLDEQDQPITTNIQQVKEFGIDNISKYERHTVNVDLSSEKLEQMSDNKNPEFKEEQTFLKVIVEGKATLYQYDKNNASRFFFKTDSIQLNQLIYKVYKVSESEIGKNRQYKQQIWMALKCDNITMASIKNLDYSKKDLLNIFVKYNQCNNTEFTNFETKEKKDLFNLSIRPGIKTSSLSVTNEYTPQLNRDFGSKAGFRLGVEFEYVLPYNRNKWALIVEPTYQSYKATKPDYGKESEINYQSIELPIGARHYFFLNENSKIFVNAQYVVEKAFSSEAKILFNSYITDEKRLEPRNSYAFGLGYNYKKKYIAEFRIGNKDILGNYVYWRSSYKTISLIFGYTIF